MSKLLIMPFIFFSLFIVSSEAFYVVFDKETQNRLGEKDFAKAYDVINKYSWPNILSEKEAMEEIITLKHFKEEEIIRQKLAVINADILFVSDTLVEILILGNKTIADSIPFIKIEEHLIPSLSKSSPSDRVRVYMKIISEINKRDELSHAVFSINNYILERILSGNIGLSSPQHVKDFLINIIKTPKITTGQYTTYFFPLLEKISSHHEYREGTIYSQEEIKLDIEKFLKKIIGIIEYDYRAHVLEKKLLYRGSKYKEEDPYISTENAERSLSYGNSIFAGHSADTGGSVIRYLKSEKVINAYALPIDPYTYIYNWYHGIQNISENHNLFLVSPLSGIQSLNTNGELFHSRSRISDTPSKPKQIIGLGVEIAYNPQVDHYLEGLLIDMSTLDPKEHSQKVIDEISQKWAIN